MNNGNKPEEIIDLMLKAKIIDADQKTQLEYPLGYAILTLPRKWMQDWILKSVR